MVRIAAFFVGLAFCGVMLFSLVSGAYAYLTVPQEKPSSYAFHKEAKDVTFTSDGPFGKFDRQQLQRGFQVYKEVCAACHGLNYVAFRNLADLGYNEAEVKKIASDWAIQVPSINPDTGEAMGRPPLPSDKFPSPYPNEVAARAANNNAVPPDLTLMAKARENGPAYIYSLLTGYQNPPANLPEDARPGKGLYYNPYFPTLNLAMPAPIVADGQVTYADGTPATIDQMSKDVTAFMVWTAEPFLETRHRVGWATLIFLLIGTTLAYFAYKNIWADRKRKGGQETTSYSDPDKVGPLA
ncbi:MAG TPA: cytochrome c1 [Sphingomonadaceae bacterium]|nr:cytochrome c1 [Sphingomonadaceae bacterium]